MRDILALKQLKTTHAFREKFSTVLIIFFIISFFSISLYSCAPKYGRHEPDQRHALQTLAGGVAGVLIAGNTGGAIVGAFVADIVSVTTIKYEDRLLENGDQAARRYREQEQKAEERKEQERKAEEIKEQEQKAEDQKERERKAEEQRDQDRKAEDRREKEKKAEKKKPGDKRVKLIIEDSSVASHTVRTGESVKADIRYTLLAPEGIENITITETRRLWTAYSSVELDTRNIIRSQGTYRSSIQFNMPGDIPKGYCILYTTVSDGRQVKTAQSVLKVL